MTYRNVPYEVDDLHAIVEQYDKLEREKRTIKQTASAEAGAKTKRQAELLKEGAELGIPKSLLKKKFKKRAKQADINDIDHSVEEDDAEIWDELNSDVDEFDSTPLAQAAATEESKEQSPVDEAGEQAEGEKVLARGKGKLTEAQKAARNPVGFDVGSGV